MPKKLSVTLLVVNKDPDAKKSPELKTCLDCEALNDITISDANSLSRIDDILDQLNGTEYFTNLDLVSVYSDVKSLRYKYKVSD